MKQITTLHENPVDTSTPLNVDQSKVIGTCVSSVSVSVAAGSALQGDTFYALCQNYSRNHQVADFCDICHVYLRTSHDSTDSTGQPDPDTVGSYHTRPCNLPNQFGICARTADYQRDHQQAIATRTEALRLSHIS